MVLTEFWSVSGRGPGHPLESPHDYLLRRSLAISRRALLPIGLFSLMFNLLALAVPLYMMQIYDRVLTSRSHETLLYLTLLAVGVLVVMALLDMVRAALTLRVSAWLERSLAPEAFARAIEGALCQRDYTTQALRDLATIRSVLGGQIVFTLCDALWAPLYLAVIFLLHPWLGTAAVAGSAILLGLALLNERLTRGPLQEANSLWIKGLQTADLAVRNAAAVVGMGLTRGVTARWLADHDRALERQIAASWRSSTIVAVTKVSRLALQIALLGIGALLVLTNDITAGAMIAASIILSRGVAPIEQAIGTWKQIVGYRAARTRLLQFFACPPLPRQGMALPAPHGRLSVEAVVFAPPGIAEAVLKRVSFTAGPAEVVAVVGPSAAGKSSLARLLVGAWPPTAGHVRLDGAEIYDWPREDLGRHIGYLPQEVELFAGTVRENIARLAVATDAEVVRAARLAGVHDLILHLPKGYQTEIGEGGLRLSAGQRQRVALARAVFGAPRLVVLDEPNASLDADGERALAKAVLALKASGAVIIVISQRQSILRQADTIVLLRNGVVEQFGPRDDVLRRLLPPPARAGDPGSPLPAVAAAPAERTEQAAP